MNKRYEYLLYLAYLGAVLWLCFTDRSNFELIPVYAILSTLYCILVLQIKSLRTILIVGLLARVILFFNEPLLSDDYYRFYWDAQMHAKGVSPYQYKPSEAIEKEVTKNFKVFNKLNSKDYYSIYPGLNQSIYYAAYFLSKGDLKYFVFFLRVFQLMAEVFLVYWLASLLSLIDRKLRPIAWYLLNPLVLIEITGNIHFEVYMAAGICGLMYYLYKKKYIHAIMGLSLAVGAKLIPLMFLPLIWRHLGFIKGLLFSSVVFFLATLMLLMYMDLYQLDHFFESCRLYYQTFEFNASIFYVVRAIGLEIYGWDIIQNAGPVLTFIATACILFISLYIKRSFISMVGSLYWILFIHLLFSTTIHPWYIIPLLPLSIILQYKSALVWSIVVFLSYAAYKDGYVREEPLIIVFEYALVIFFLLLDLKIIKHQFKPKLLKPRK